MSIFWREFSFDIVHWVGLADPAQLWEAWPDQYFTLRVQQVLSNPSISIHYFARSQKNSMPGRNIVPVNATVTPRRSGKWEMQLIIIVRASSGLTINMSAFPGQRPFVQSSTLALTIKHGGVTALIIIWSWLYPFFFSPVYHHHYTDTNIMIHNSMPSPCLTSLFRIRHRAGSIWRRECIHWLLF